MSGTNVLDTTSGFRATQKSAAEQINVLQIIHIHWSQLFKLAKKIYYRKC